MKRSIEAWLRVMAVRCWANFEGSPGKFLDLRNYTYQGTTEKRELLIARLAKEGTHLRFGVFLSRLG